MNEVNPHAGGCSLTGVLTVIFIALKLTGLINWSWWWVLCPLWIYAAVLVFLVVIAAVVLEVIEEKERGEK